MIRVTLWYPDNRTIHTGAITITKTGTAALEETRYEFPIEIEVDADATDDGDDADSITDNDVDVEYTATVVVDVLDLTDGATLTFHLENGQIYQGNRVSTFGKDLDTDPQVFTLTGLQSSHKIVRALVCDESAANARAACTPDTELELDDTIDGNKFPIVIKDGGIGTGGVTASVLVEVDTDTGTDGDDSGTDKDDDVDITFVEVLSLSVINNTENSANGGTTPIMIATVTPVGADKALAADVTIKENASAGHGFGRMSVEGVLTDGTTLEHLDGVITDSGRFTVRTNSRGATAAEGHNPVS